MSNNSVIARSVATWRSSQAPWALNSFFLRRRRGTLDCFAVLAMTILFLSSAHALTLEEPLPNPAQEEAARDIFHELRCVVCQSESLADSSAQVAVDMRREIRAQVAAGKPHDKIISYFTSRYGNYVLMRPQFNYSTAALWLAPPIIILLGGMLSVLYFFRGPKSTRQ
jgi:cytochrome c-type biogenesis protein CcmH